MMGVKPKKTFFQKMAEFLFVVYLSTVYMFDTQYDKVYISHIFFILFAGTAAVYFLQRKRFYLGKNVLLMYFFCTWIFASVFWAANEYIANMMIKTMWQIFILFFIVYNLFCEKKTEDAYEFYIKALYTAGIVFVVYTMCTYGVTDVIKMMSDGNNVRIGADVAQTNTFGINHATTTIIAFYYLIYKSKHRLFHMVVLFLTFVFAMASGSRTAVLIICIGALYLIYRRYSLRKFYKTIVVILLVIIVFVSAIQLPMFETVRLRMEQMVNNIIGTSGGDSSSRVRMNMILIGWKLLQQRMLTGYGAGNYGYVSNYNTYAHNNFVEILADYGLIGFIVCYTTYIIAFKNLRKNKSSSAKVLFCIFIVKFLMEIATITYYDKLHWIMLAFCLMQKREETIQLQEETGVKLRNEKLY